MKKRIFDFLLSIFVILVLFIPLITIAILIKLTSKGPVFYWSNRVGRDNCIFKMPKFRTMVVDTPTVATHLLSDPSLYITPVGKFLREFSIDEFPQLYCILKGDMSFVGPRPALFNQDDLIELRTIKGVHKLVPGLTGWAQLNGRDELPIPVKVEYDVYYLHNRSLLMDVKIISTTFFKILMREGVTH